MESHVPSFDPHDIDDKNHASQELQKSILWDEDVFGAKK